jgi:hypothetical protein
MAAHFSPTCADGCSPLCSGEAGHVSYKQCRPKKHGMRRPHILSATRPSMEFVTAIAMAICRLSAEIAAAA